jgi:hypothetical protein
MGLCKMIRERSLQNIGRQVQGTEWEFTHVPALPSLLISV